MKFRRAYILIILSTLVIITFLILTLVKFAGPKLLLSSLQDDLHDTCPSCKLEIKDLQLAFFPSPQIIVSELSFYINESPDSEVSMTIENADFTFEIWPLVHHEIVIDAADVEKPNVKLTEADLESPKKHSESKNSDWFFSIQKTAIRKGIFEYVRNTHGTSATLHIHQISVDAGELNSDRHIDKVLSAHATARIEGSGEVELQTKIKSLIKPVTLEFEVKAHGQKLSDLSSFFKPNAGVILSGSLLNGRGLVLLNGENLESRVWAEYKDLNVEITKTYDRSEAAAFFTNLASALVMAKKNKGKAPEDQTSSTHLTREPNEPIIAFILRGLKEAALKVTKM